MKKTLLFLCCLFFLPAAHAAFADCERGGQLYRQALEQTEDLRGRIELLQESLAECRNYNAYYELGKAYEAGNDFKEAELALLNAKSLASGDKPAAKVLARLGIVNEKMGDMEMAAQYYRKSLSRYEYKKVRSRLVEIDSMAMEHPKSADQIAKGLVLNRKGFEPVTLYINFEFDSFTLSPDGRKQAEELAAALRSPAFAGNNFTLVGHTDATGDAYYNQTLSEKRAAAVKDYLVRHFSVAPQIIRTEGRGENEPLHPGDSEKINALNRRVQVSMQ